MQPEYAYLTTTGRRSSRPHTVELWYCCLDGTVWFITEEEDPEGHGRPDWVRNIQADPRVTVRVGEHVLNGTARVVPVDHADAATTKARRTMAARYQEWHPGAPLSRWAGYGLAVGVADIEV